MGTGQGRAGRRSLGVILKMFEAVDGPTGSFRVRDWDDWNFTDGVTEMKTLKIYVKANPQ